MTRDKVDATAAAAALRDSSALTEQTMRDARWYARYMTLFGIGFAVITVLLGLGPDQAWWPVVVLVGWGVLVGFMVTWAVRRPVQPSVRARRYVPGWVATGVASGVALFAGLSFEWPVWAWLAAAIVVATPLLISAWQLRRGVA